jgi:type IV pilus assembly protein PilN
MVRINLLPVRVSRKKEKGKQELWLFVALAVLGLVVNGLWSKDRNAELATHTRKLAKTRADIEALDRIIGEVKSIRAQQQAVQEKLDVLEKLKQGRAGPVRMLDELASLTPKRVWLRRFAQKGAAVTFDGSAVTIDDVSSFMTALKQSEHFRSVELKHTETKAAAAGAARTVDFTIETTVEYGPPAAAPAVNAAQTTKPAGG